MIKVLYEDNHLLILDKPTGLPTQPSPGSEDSLEEQAKVWLKKKYDKPGQVYLHAIHRLDKGASGIVVFAKTSKALSRLNEASRNKAFTKRYLAYVEGRPKHKEGKLEHYLVHDDYRAKVVSKETKGAKLAMLKYQIVNEGDNFSLLSIDLETGRYHQIRAQLAAIGCPIVGDIKYGSKTPTQLPGIPLHHSTIAFLHPITSKEIVITCDPPWNASTC